MKYFTAILAAVLIALVFGVFGLGCGHSRQQSVEKRQTSEWGSIEGGLQMRVTAPAEIEVGMPLRTNIEIRYERGQLSPGIKRLNEFLRDDFLELLLTDPQGKKSWTVKPYDPTAGMPAFDTGKAAVPLDGSQIKTWKAKFPLLKLYDELKPGAYVARVRFTFPKKPTRYWRATEAEWKQAGYWHGTLLSDPFPLRLLEETPKTKTLSVPRKLRLRKKLVRLHEGDTEDTAVPAIYFDQRDAQQIKVPVRNGHSLGTWLYYNGEPKQLNGGLLTPNGPNAIDAWYDYKGGDKNVSYTIEVFETPDVPQHRWMPGPGSAGYKVLWKKTFPLSLSAEEIQRVITRRADGERKDLPDE